MSGRARPIPWQESAEELYTRYRTAGDLPTRPRTLSLVLSGTTEQEAARQVATGRRTLTRRLGRCRTAVLAKSLRRVPVLAALAVCMSVTAGCGGSGHTASVRTPKDIQALFRSAVGNVDSATSLAYTSRGDYVFPAVGTEVRSTTSALLDQLNLRQRYHTSIAVMPITGHVQAKAIAPRRYTVDVIFQGTTVYYRYNRGPWHARTSFTFPDPRSAIVWRDAPFKLLCASHAFARAVRTSGSVVFVRSSTNACPGWRGAVDIGIAARPRPVVVSQSTVGNQIGKNRERSTWSIHLSRFNEPVIIYLPSVRSSRR